MDWDLHDETVSMIARYKDGYGEISKLVRTLGPAWLRAEADKLDEYGNGLPDGVTTEAFAAASNLRDEANRLIEGA